MGFQDFDDIVAGGIQGRPLYVCLLLDCSGSMKRGGKIASLNFAIRMVIPALRAEAEGHPGAQILIRAMVFSNSAKWINPEFVRIEDYVWTDVPSEGLTTTGAALSLLAEAMKQPPMPSRALPPLIVLVSDGMATDDFEAGLHALLAQTWGRKALRFAIAIGDDASLEELTQFVSQPQIGVLRADNQDMLLRELKWATVQGSRSSLTPGSAPKASNGEYEEWRGAPPPEPWLGDPENPLAW
jgi:uncharacterized protein YegL